MLHPNMQSIIARFSNQKRRINQGEILFVLGTDLTFSIIFESDSASPIKARTKE
jgi:hypothetical protein